MAKQINKTPERINFLISFIRPLVAFLSESDMDRFADVCYGFKQNGDVDQEDFEFLESLANQFSNRGVTL